MGNFKIIALICALLSVCSVSAQDTLHVQQYLGIGASTQMVVSGDTITAGMPVYINRTNGRVYRADKSVEEKQAQAIALTTCLPNDTTTVCYSGRITDYPGPLSKGNTYYLSGTKGGIVSDKTDASSGFQKLGIAIDTFEFEVSIDDVVETTATPGLDDVTAVGATSYNNIVISDGVFPVLTLHGTDSAFIKFVDPVEENDLTVHPPSTITSTWHQYLPNKNGVFAMLSDIPAGGSGDITNGGNTTGAAVTIGTNDANALSFETNNVVRQTITGGASTGGAQTFTDVTANTNTVENAITLQANSTGTAATGFGAALLTKLESSTTDNQDASAIKTYWTNGTHASREAAIGLFLGDAGGALAEAFKFDRAAQSSGALSIGTSGASVYYNGGITPGSSFQIGGNTNGISILSSANSATNGIIIANNSGLSSSVGAISIGGGAVFSTTSNTRNYMNFDYSFSPTSGTAVHNSLVFSGTVNQTGGANGIVRRVYDNTTTTSVADYRSLEIAVNTANAKGVYQTGASTSNNLVGKTHFGATTAPTSSLTVTGANGYTQFRLVTQYTPTGTDDANGSAGDVAVDDDYIYFKTASGWKRTALSTF